MSVYAFHHQMTFELEECCSCHAPFMMTSDAQKRLLKNHKGFYCPYCGTRQSYTGKTEEQKLKEQLKAETQRKEAALRRANEARIEADKMRDKEEVQRKSKLRIQSRIKNGVCPCCNRTFKNLQRHMQTKHKDFISNSENLKVIREDLELSQTKLARSLDIQASYISSYEHKKYLPEYAKDILDKFVEENS